MKRSLFGVLLVVSAVLVFLVSTTAAQSPDEQAILKLLESDDHWKRKREIIESVPGLGPVNSATLVAELSHRVRNILAVVREETAPGSRTYADCLREKGKSKDDAKEDEKAEASTEVEMEPMVVVVNYANKNFFSAIQSASCLAAAPDPSSSTPCPCPDDFFCLRSSASRNFRLWTMLVFSVLRI